MTTPAPRLQRGQALTELAICAALLVPLFLLIPIVAKYGHANQVAQQAARNATWEATVSDAYDLPKRSALQKKAIDRNFAAADAPIRTNPTGSASGEFGDQMLNTFSNRKLLERDNLSVSSIGQASSPGFLSKTATLLPELNGKGYVTAKVKLDYRNLQTTDGGAATYLDPFDKLNIVQTRQQTLLVDAWNASGPRAGKRQVVKTIKPLAPASWFDGLGKLFDMFGALEPILPMVGSLGDLEFGTIEPDVVPADRLADYPVKK